MDIEEIIRHSDFSGESARYKERLRQKLFKSSKILSESELLQVTAAAGGDNARFKCFACGKEMNEEDSDGKITIP